MINIDYVRVRNQVGEQVSCQVWNQVFEHLEDQVEYQVYNQILSELHDQLYYKDWEVCYKIRQKVWYD
jgi:hypothetical protein